LPVIGRAALIASVAASEVRLWRACLLPSRIRPDGSATGIPRDRLHVRSGMDRLIHSEIRIGRRRHAHVDKLRRHANAGDHPLNRPPVCGTGQLADTTERPFRRDAQDWANDQTAAQLGGSVRVQEDASYLAIGREMGASGCMNTRACLDPAMPSSAAGRLSPNLLAAEFADLGGRLLGR
jgi:hypothetical protein